MIGKGREEVNRAEGSDWKGEGKSQHNERLGMGKQIARRRA